MIPGMYTCSPSHTASVSSSLPMIVFIHQHGLFLVQQHGGAQVVAQGSFVVYDLHGAPAQHVAWAHEHRIADAPGGFHARLDAGYGLALRLRDAEFLH